MHEALVLIDAVIFNAILLLGGMAMIVIVAITLLRELREGFPAGQSWRTVRWGRLLLLTVGPLCVLAYSAMGLISCYIVWAGG